MMSQPVRMSYYRVALALHDPIDKKLEKKIERAATQSVELRSPSSPSPLHVAHRSPRPEQFKSEYRQSTRI